MKKLVFILSAGFLFGCSGNVETVEVAVKDTVMVDSLTLEEDSVVMSLDTVGVSSTADTAK